jgi:hypothetical protein|tara:strand:- start:363 stop:728 length:366 start_codon:yes stop_codon:yes gene_type:complete
MSKINTLSTGYNNAPKNTDKPVVKVHNKRIKPSILNKIETPKEKSVKINKNGIAGGLNTLSAGYNSHPTTTTSTNVKPAIVDTSIKINPTNLTNKIKMWHADGVLTTDGVNYIIIELQKII